MKKDARPSVKRPTTWRKWGSMLMFARCSPPIFTNLINQEAKIQAKFEIYAGGETDRGQGSREIPGESDLIVPDEALENTRKPRLCSSVGTFQLLGNQPTKPDMQNMFHRRV